MNRHERNALVCPKCGSRFLRRPFDKALGKRVDDPLVCVRCGAFVNMTPKKDTDRVTIKKEEAK